MLYHAKKLLLLALPFLFLACSSIRLPNYPDSSNDFKSTGNKGSSAATMRPYTINDKTYYPTTVNVGDTASGTASWYGPNFHGKKTSNGETYNMNAMTAAHKTLPMNTMVKVTNLNNNRQTIVRINDRGPFVAGRVIDLSKAAANEIAMLGTGTAPVKLEIVGFSGQTTASVNNSSSNTAVYTGTGVSGGVITAAKSAAKNAATNAATNIQNKVQNAIATSFSGGVFMVQIGAFKNGAGAQSFSTKNNGAMGYRTVIKTFEIDGDTIYRVFLTGFRSEAEARDFIDAKHFGGAFIVRE